VANDLSAFDAQVWSKSLIANLDRVNVMIGKTNRQWDGLLENVGDTVQVRTLGSVTVRSYSRNQTLSYEDLTPTKEPLTVNDAEYFAFRVDDVDKVQNDVDALNGYTMRAATAMSNKIEDKILSAYSSALAANKITSGGAGASGNGSAVTLTSTTAGTSVYDNLVLARECMDVQNVPLYNDDGTSARWVVVSPAVVSLLLKDTTHFIRSTEMGDKVAAYGTVDGSRPPRPGLVGMCAGFEIYTSNALPVGRLGQVRRLRRQHGHRLRRAAPDGRDHAAPGHLRDRRARPAAARQEGVRRGGQAPRIYLCRQRLIPGDELTPDHLRARPTAVQSGGSRTRDGEPAATESPRLGPLPPPIALPIRTPPP
jgi:hypothetical protein